MTACWSKALLSKSFILSFPWETRQLTCTKGRWCEETLGEVTSYMPKSKAWNGSFSKNQPCQHLDLRLWVCGTVKFWFKSPSMWHFAVATMGKWYSCLIPFWNPLFVGPELILMVPRVVWPHKCVVKVWTLAHLTSDKEDLTLVECRVYTRCQLNF
jgi:hypothetical protein